MGLYSVVLKPSVEKDFRQLPKNVLTRVIRLIEGLAANPFPYNSVKLSGTRELYRLRLGDYRIIYEVDATGKLVTIHYVRHRREAYRRTP